MKLNRPPKPTEFTHQGAPAARLNIFQKLRRSVLACLLWEKEFYEDGISIADQITTLAKALKDPVGLSMLACQARSDYKLRHVPLLLCSILAEVGKGSSVVADTIAHCIHRADEPAEFLAIHANRNGVKASEIKPIITNQMRKGLARAFHRFDAYQLAKYDRPGEIRLRDVLFLCHPKPASPEQEDLWKRLIDGTLEPPDTWEVALSGGADKKEAFTRLLKEENLGYLALLRNLRNMVNAGVKSDLIRKSIRARKGAQWVLPFRYVAAARACPQMEPDLDAALLASLEYGPQTMPGHGKTFLLIDVSGSMDSRLSAKSDLTRMDAAATLASIWPGADRVFTFSQSIKEVPPRKGMAGVDAIRNSQLHGGTYLGDAIRHLNKEMEPEDRLIVLTDEQSADRVPDPRAKTAYMVNVASYQRGIGSGRWNRVDGFSEHIIRYIRELEMATKIS